MRTLYADLHPDTLEYASSAELAALVLELVDSLQTPATFVETSLQHEQPHLIEAIERLYPFEAVALAEQVCRLLKQRMGG